MDPEALELLIIDTLEQLAFLMGSPAAREALPQAIEQGIAVEVDVVGNQRSGKVRMACPRQFGYELAANQLGLDDPEEAELEDVEDALKELVNVIAGRALAALPEAAELLDLGAPYLEEDPQSERWSALRTEAAACGLEIEEHPVLFHLNVPGIEPQ